MTTVPNPQRLVIDRAKWLRGEGSNPSRLLRESDGKMCCLGFLAKECGLEDEDIRDVATPWSACRATGGDRVPTPGKRMPIWTTQFSDGSVSTIHRVIATNDSVNLTDEERERFLTERFAEVGITVEFV